MITQLLDLPDNVLGFSATGRVTAEDYETKLIPAVDALFKRRDKIRFLYYLGEEFTGFSAGAMLDDAKVGLKHCTGWERIAVVTDIEWVRAGVRIFGFTIPGQIRLFHNSELVEAKRWLSE